MSWQLATAVLLALGAGLAVLRAVRRRARGWVVWLQVPAAVLLYFVLYPPLRLLQADALTILTPGAGPAAIRAVPGDQRIVALPGAPLPPGAEFAPDLATALRRHPGITRVRVIGSGLAARDRPAAAALAAVVFDAPPAGGLVQLQSPPRVPLGRAWQLSGRTAGGVRRVELRDPSGAVVDAVPVDATGAFALTGAARGDGTARFQLRLLDAAGKTLDTVSVPLIITRGGTLRLIVRSGPVNPELKYLRRWALDAGVATSLTAVLSEGVALHDGDAQLDASTLATADLVIVDARGWATLTGGEKIALAAAVEQGLGLLLRADGPLAPDTASDWATLGFKITAAGAPGATGATAVTAPPGSVTLDRALGLHDRTPFTIAALDVAAPDGRIGLAADDASPLFWWRSQGAGRIGLLRLVDSFRLVLRGDGERYGDLWAGMLERLSRAHAAASQPPAFPEPIWVAERAVFCGLGSSAEVRVGTEAPAVGLTVDAQGCAAYWPAVAGWQSLESHGEAWPFYVRAADDGASWRASRDRQATLDLVTPGASAATPAAWPRLAGWHAPALSSVPMSRWPWFSAWLVLTAALWWLERRDFRLAGRVG
jgi:hypothetical protein